MKSYGLQFLAAFFIPLAFACSVFAVDVDLAVTGFTAFQPSPIAPGGHPTSITYSLHNYGPGSVGSGGGFAPILIDLWISSNGTFGDGDDLYLGQMQFSISSPAGSDGTYTHSNVNGLSGFAIPAEADGNYQVFLKITHPPGSGRTDPDLSDNIGLLTGTITVGSNGAPEIAVEQPAGTNLIDGTSSIDFGSVNLGSSSAAFTFTIRNIGTASLTGLAVTKDGSHAPDFAVGSLGATSLAPGASTTFTVTFSPGAAGSRSAAIHIASNDADENPFDFSIQGTGAVPAPEITVSGNSVNITDGDGTPSLADHTDFGSVDVSGGTVVRAFTIANTGNANLTVGTVTVAGTHAADFIVTQQPSSPIAAGNSMSFQVTFDPSAAGLRSASLSFSNNDADENPFNYSIQGTGTLPLPEVAVSGNSRNIADGDSTPNAADHTDFGSADVSGGMVVRTFTIANSGSANLTVGGVTVGGTHAADFKVTQQPSSTVAPGNSTTFQVTFDPSAAGLRTAALNFSNNDGDESPFNYSIQGTGLDLTPPTVINVSPSFAGGTLAVGATSLRIAFRVPVTGGDRAENYQLQSLGPDALLGTADDSIVPVSVAHTGTTATLGFLPLGLSVYRLTVRDVIVNSVGTQLDGDGDGIPGGDWLVDFAVIPMIGALAFEPLSPFSSGGPFPMSVAVSDLNGDGHQDLAVVGQASGNIAVHLGVGDGSFATAIQKWVGSGFQSVATGDFNGDGRSDLAIAGYLSPGSVGVLLGNGDGTFGALSTYGSGGTYAAALTVGDANGDGRQDLAVVNQLGTGGDTVAVLLGLGDGTFAPATAYGTGGEYPSSVAFGDFNRDGRQDLAVANFFDGTGILLGYGDGTFTAVTGYAGYGPSSIAVGDLNDDGYQDLAMAHDEFGSGTVGVQLGRPDGTFAPVVTYSSGGERPSTIAIADFNGDSRQDLTVVNQLSGNVAVLLGRGDGTFSAPMTYDSGGDNPYAVTVGDFNHDHRPDIVIGNFRDANLRVLLNESSSIKYVLSSPIGFTLDIQVGGFMAGQLVQGPDNAFDGLNRLQVSGADYATTENSATHDGGRTVVTGNQNLAGLIVHREITVPATGNEDFARTVDVFQNPTGSAITTTVRIVGNLGSDASTTVFATSDGNTVIEPGDQWIGTDDGDGTGTPAIVHYIHGPAGLQPTYVIRTGDNIEWTYQLTVLAGQTVRLAHFTILAQRRADAIAAANAIVTPGGFGGQAAAFLTQAELDSLANFGFDQPVSLNARHSGNELILSWPTSAVGFTLQSTLDLTPPVTWTDSTFVPAFIGAQFTVTNTLSGRAKFYRLKK